MISKYFDVVRATDTPDNYLSVGYDVDVIEYKHETIKSDKPSKLVSLEKGDILVGTVKQQVALFVGDFETYAQQGWKVLRLKDGADIDVIGLFVFMNTVEFTRQLGNAYQGESVNNLIPSELVKLDVDIRLSRGQMTKDFMLQIRLRKLIERRISLIKELKKGMMQRMFPKNGSKIPESRIAGFADDWVKCEFATFIERINTSSDSDLIPKVEFEDIKSGMGYLNKDISRKFDDRKGTLFQPKDILFGKLRPYLKNWLFPDFMGVALGDFWVFRALNSNPEFAYVLIQSPKFQAIANDTAGTKMPRSDWKIVSNSEFWMPSIKEQTKIGEFFKHLDNLITVNERELNKIKDLKKSYLEKTFPKNGSDIPELRFPGYTDAWEEYKLGELSNIVSGGTPSTSNTEHWDGDIDWYTPAEIGEQSYVSKSKKTITELGLKKSSARILPIGTVLFTSRAGIGNTAILAKEASTNQGFQSIVPDQNKLDSYFIFSRTKELKRYGEVTGAGSTFVEVSGKQMSKMSIMAPELSEQQKIGSFFKQLDDTIALHQRKLDLLEEQKKGYLQKKVSVERSDSDWQIS